LQGKGKLILKYELCRKLVDRLTTATVIRPTTSHKQNKGKHCKYAQCRRHSAHILAVKDVNAY